MAFDSPEAKQLNKDIFECIYFHALTTSSALAKVDGELPALSPHCIWSICCIWSTCYIWPYLASSVRIALCLITSLHLVNSALHQVNLLQLFHNSLHLIYLLHLAVGVSTWLHLFCIALCLITSLHQVNHCIWTTCCIWSLCVKDSGHWGHLAASRQQCSARHAHSNVCQL